MTDPQRVAAFVLAHSDQTIAILKSESDHEALQSLVGAVVDMRDLLIEENGVAPQVADAAIIGMTATLCACLQIEKLNES